MPASGIRQFGLIFAWLICCLTVAAAADKTTAIVAPTVADATKVFDPSKVPVLKDAEPTRKLVGGFTYQGPGTPPEAFKFYQQHLGQLKWKELPNSYVSEMSCSGSFAQADYLVSLSISPSSKPNTVLVTLRNQGNLNLKKLPVPKGAKSLFSFPGNEALVTDQAKADAAADVSRLLRAQQWEPYGTAGDTLFFKQRAIRLSAFVVTAPAQGNKTMITYSASLMSADLPAPAETIGLQYADTTTTLSFDSGTDEAEMVRFYNESLGKLDWKPTLDKPVKIGIQDEVIYRNPAHDMLVLGMQTVDDKLRVSVRFTSAAEVAELEAQAKVKMAATKNAPKTETAAPVISIELPEEAKEIKASKREIEFKIADGKSKPFAESLVKRFKDDGWKEISVRVEPKFGNILYENGNQRVTIQYLETGVRPAEFTITTRGADLQMAEKK